MSLTKPSNKQPHPCSRWLEWQGEKGTVVYYDKEQKKNIELGPKLTFIVLDQLSLVTGWHDKSSSGVTSNEVRDSRSEIMAVRAFKGGPLFAGLYSDIRDKVAAIDCSFTNNIYMATSVNKELTLSSWKLHGAALNAWIEFYKNNREYVDKGGGVTISGVKTGIKGKIKFVTPEFGKVTVPEHVLATAMELDTKLQAFLDTYFAKQADPVVPSSPTHQPSDNDGHQEDPPIEEPPPEESDASSTESDNGWT